MAKNLMKVLFLVLYLFSATISAQAKTYTLTECETQALKHSHKITQSELEHSSAKEAKKEAFTNYFPTVKADGGYMSSKKDLLKTEVGMGGAVLPVDLLREGMYGTVSITQPIFAGGRITNSNKLAKIAEESAALQSVLAQKDVKLQTAAYYWQIVSLKEKLKTVQSMEKYVKTLHKDVSAAVEAGLAMNNDILQVELRAQEIASSKITLENALQITKEAFAQFLQVSEKDFDIKYDGKTQYYPPEKYLVDTNKAVQKRLETELLGKQVEAAKLQTKIKDGENLPTLAVGGAHVHHDLFDRTVDSNMVYATVSVPISSWWGGTHAHRKNKYQEQEAKDRKQDGIELMKVETDKAYHNLEEAYAQIKLAEKSIKSAKENLRLVDNYYKAGTKTLTDVLDAQTLSQNSQDMFADAFSRYQIILTNYKRITE